MADRWFKEAVIYSLEVDTFKTPTLTAPVTSQD